MGLKAQLSEEVGVQLYDMIKTTINPHRLFQTAREEVGKKTNRS